MTEEKPAQVSPGDLAAGAGPTEPSAAQPLAPAAGPTTTYDGNQQQVDRGLAVVGSVRDITVNYAVLDGEADGKVVKPRFREGLYPESDVADRLRAFVKPPSYPACREQLDGRRILLLRGEAGAGTSTAALALLRDVTKNDRITGLDSATDLTEWSPSAAGGYLVQGISPEGGEHLDEVALNQLTNQLRGKHAFLVVIVTGMAGLPRALTPWCRTHIPPEPSDVARALLQRMADEGAFTGDQLANAFTALDQPPFEEYLAAGRSPAAGVEVAEELREVVANGRTSEEAADNLRLGSAEAAAQLLKTVRGNADDLALTAAIALLEEQDRSVVERLTAQLRPLLAARLEPTAARANDDLLGRDIHGRLAAVQAKTLSRTVGAARGYRYWVEPVAFRGKHLAEEVLRRLWLDYEGFSDVLLTWMRGLPYEPGLDRIAGRRIGRVLCQASGPDVLRQLSVFAHSRLGWQRRLAGYALGEAVQDVVLSGAVRTQLRQWSRAQKPEPRCTVAETCAGSLGLALPAFALSLLHTVLEGAEDQLDGNLHKAVSAALGVQLTEDSNRKPVLEQISSWLGEPDGTARHAYALQAVQALCVDGFPAINRAGIRRLKLADVFADNEDLLVPLVLAALDDKVLHEAMTTALTRLEKALGPDRQEQMDTFLTSLSEASGGHQGLRVFLLTRYRAHSAAPAEELR
ncbi:hypothetical protein AB0I82_03890 [Streptomyces sp. NPDC050315]|uniref:hypothetical protein n=1 Tax=Streptomyces sp. NPDC050315 TaxID=3155039 RepID=UPI00341C527D